MLQLIINTSLSIVKSVKYGFLMSSILFTNLLLLKGKTIYYANFGIIEKNEISFFLIFDFCLVKLDLVKL
jgi:hypothetical protein